MTVTVLFTYEDSKAELQAAGEHLVAGGVWLRQVEEDGMQKAYVYCLDKTVLNDFVIPFGLTNIKVDVTLEIGDYLMSVAMIKFWGKKLNAVLDWKQQVEAPSSPTSISSCETGLRRFDTGQSAEGV